MASLLGTDIIQPILTNVKGSDLQGRRRKKLKTEEGSPEVTGEGSETIGRPTLSGNYLKLARQGVKHGGGKPETTKNPKKKKKTTPPSLQTTAWIRCAKSCEVGSELGKRLHGAEIIKD